jgi:MFS family permease
MLTNNEPATVNVLPVRHEAITPRNHKRLAIALGSHPMSGLTPQRGSRRARPRKGTPSCPDAPRKGVGPLRSSQRRSVFHKWDIWGWILVTRVAAEAPSGNRLRYNRDFQFLLTGSSVSMLGSRLTAIGLPLLVLALKGSPLVAGWAGFAVAAPSILIFLPAGALTDRWNPRPAMITSEIGRGAAIATVVALILVLHRPSVALLIALVVVEEMLGVFSALAERRMICSLVEPGNTVAALASAEGRTHVVVLLGRSLGGFLFGLGQALPFLADAVSFGFSAAVLMRIKPPRELPDSDQPAADQHLGREISAGLRWAWDDQFTRFAFPLTACATLISQALIMVFLAEAHTRDLSGDRIGLVLAASGAGGAIGSAAACRLFRYFKYHLLRVQMWIWAGMFIVLALSGGRSFTLMAVALTVAGFAGALGNIALDNYMFRERNKKMLGRSTSIARLTTSAGLALGPLFGGAIAEQFGTGRSIYVLSAFVLLTPAAAIFARPQPTDVPQPIEFEQPSLTGPVDGPQSASDGPIPA